MERGNEWSVRVARDIGGRVKHYRKQADLTASMLSDRCAGLGLPMDRNVIAKLENGHRNSVTVDEVLVLAAALGVPPVQLVFGGEDGLETEVLPGRAAGALEAAHWFAGTTVLDPDTPGFATRRPRTLRELTAAALLDQHDASVAEVRQSVVRSDWLGGGRLAAAHLELTESRLREIRGEMRHRGLALPGLDAGLAYIDS